MYCEKNPNNEYLRLLVDKFWKFNQSAANLEPLYIHPDGSTDVIVRENANGETSLFACGVMSRTRKVAIEKGDSFWGIRFKPGMASLCLGIPINEITDDLIELNLISKNLSRLLHNELIKGLSFRGLEESIFEALFNNFDSFDSFYLKAKQIRMIGSITFGNLSKVAEEVNSSRRTLLREFKTHYGLSFREFSTLNKFIKFKTKIDNGTLLSLSELALECGYYDQASMTRSVRKVTGFTPLQVLSQSYNT